MATIVKTDGSKVNVEPKNGNDFKLAELQSIVGGYIEIIYLPDGKIMVLNEEGKLDGLEVNIQATLLYQAAYRVDDFIVGDVLICESEQVK